MTRDTLLRPEVEEITGNGDVREGKVITCPRRLPENAAQEEEHLP